MEIELQMNSHFRHFRKISSKKSLTIAE